MVRGIHPGPRFPGLESPIRRRKKQVVKMRKLVLAAMAAAVLVAASAGLSAAEKQWKCDLRIDKSDLSSVGANPYFILKPGYQLYFKSKDGDLTITVLGKTKKIDGVETRIVEERETSGSKLVEVSLNYYAISGKDKSVYYFGEDVDTYNGKGEVTGHGGTWHAGEHGNKPGLMMPGVVKVGARYCQEVAPKVAMDRAEIVSVTESLQVPAGKFTKVLKTEETTALEPGAKEYKYYAAGIGLLKDGDMQLFWNGYAKKTH
jgi:hypothetical protein